MGARPGRLAGFGRAGHQMVGSADDADGRERSKEITPPDRGRLARAPGAKCVDLRHRLMKPSTNFSNSSWIANGSRSSAKAQRTRNLLCISQASQPFDPATVKTSTTVRIDANVLEAAK